MISAFCATRSCLRHFRRIQTGDWIKINAVTPLKYILGYFGLLSRRWLRLGFAIAVGMILSWKILPLITSGPMSVTTIHCTDSNFFESLFFINNTFAGNGVRMCAPWYWYFAADI